MTFFLGELFFSGELFFNLLLLRGKKMEKFTSFQSRKSPEKISTKNVHAMHFRLGGD